MSTMDIVKIFLILLAILALMYGVLLLMKRYLYPYANMGKSAVDVKVLATQVIMPKKFVSIVKIQEKIYVLGLSEQQITVLDTWHDEDGVFEDEMKKDEKHPKFLDYFKKNLGKK